ncbi:MAG: carboxypeptidase-like regulatory domain-containing protein [Bacteroidota bacterium]
MMKSILPLLFFLFFSAHAQSQALRGILLSKGDLKPIPSATVYLSNTMISATSNEDGSFTLATIPSGRYELVVSCIGYRTKRIEISSAALPENLTIQLEPVVKELEEVVVRNYDKEGWSKWGTFFLQQFIGITPFSADVDLINPEVIKFIHDKTTNTINAFSFQPLIIKNNALGYELYYELEQFEFNFSSKMLLFKGFPLFKEMTPKRASQARKWKDNRKDAYLGSMMHFFRALYRNQLLENGFEVRSLIEVTNEEKVRVKNLLSSRYKSNINKVPNDPILPDTIRFSNTEDSMSYYQQVMRMPDKSDFVNKGILPGDSIAYSIDSVTVGMYFDHFLQVRYPSKKMPGVIADAIRGYPPKFVGGPASFNELANGYAARDLNRMGVTNKMDMVSKVKLINNNQIVVLSNGSFFDAANLISYGYWAFWERISTLLPLDYRLPPQL